MTEMNGSKLYAGNSRIQAPNAAETIYRLADKPDYIRLHKFVADQGMPRSNMGYPTVYAERDGELIGILASAGRDDMVLVGPLVMRNDRARPIVAIRLIECIEHVMRSAGVTEYLFSTPEEQKFLQLVESLDMQPYSKQDGNVWFVRKI